VRATVEQQNISYHSGNTQIQTYSADELSAFGVSSVVIHMNSASAASYVFPPSSTDQPFVLAVDYMHFRELLLQSGAIPNLCSPVWVKNHYRWIVWRLACYERSFPVICGGRYLTQQRVLSELKHRFHKEIMCAQRSCLKKILEGDAAPGSYMILAVSQVRAEPPELELTDGWFY
jgi:hypothetical protein